MFKMSQVSKNYFERKNIYNHNLEGKLWLVKVSSNCGIPQGSILGAEIFSFSVLLAGITQILTA